MRMHCTSCMRHFFYSLPRYGKSHDCMRIIRRKGVRNPNLTKTIRYSSIPKLEECDC